MDRKINIFTVYNMQDRDVMLYLLLHLKPLEKDFKISIWQNDAIYSGQQWKPQIASPLNRADIFLLLVSNDFMHSEFIKQDEFKMVIDRYKESKSLVIPILLDDCPWDTDFKFDDYNFNLNELHFFPEDGKPISDWNTADLAFKQVIGHVKREITSFTEKIDQEEPSKKNEVKTMSTKKGEQIAIDFFEERKVNSIVEKKNQKEEAEAKTKVEEKSKPREETEPKKVIKRETRQRNKVEIQKRIKKEKRLKEKAKEDNKIEEDAKTKRIALEERQGNELKWQ